jgi:hypothetical protein
MAGYSTILEIERLKDDCDKLGFRLGYSKQGYHKTEYGDVVSLFPKDDDALPVYSRDADLFTGSLSDVKFWLRGIEWARNYDSMVIGKLNDKHRERKEQDLRNKNLVRIITKE